MFKKSISLLIVIALVFSFSICTFADGTYTVKDGDVLWKVAKGNNLTWQQLAEINVLDNPHLIYPGQVLKLSKPAPVPEVSKSQVREFVSEKVMIPSRGIEIPATFVYPKAAVGEKFPLVVMAHGHGGNREEAGGFTRVAEGLAAEGVATIRMDFPGCGESTEAFTQNNLTNMLADISASLDYSAAKPMIDTERIGMFGYSMGGRLATLSVEQEPRYKALALWAPVGTDGPGPMVPFMGGQEAYDAMAKEASEKGSVMFTTQWGQKQELGKQFFEDLNNTKALSAISAFTGPVLIVYGDKDDVIPPEIDKAVVKAAIKSSKTVEHIVAGADHGFGLYSPDPAMSTETVKVTVDFLAGELK